MKKPKLMERQIREKSVYTYFSLSSWSSNCYFWKGNANYMGGNSGQKYSKRELNFNCDNRGYFSTDLSENLEIYGKKIRTKHIFKYLGPIVERRIL